MAHVAKFDRAAAGHMLAHYDRQAENISNPNIVPERTPENYNLGPDRDISQGDFIRERCGQVKMQNRKDVNVMCSWIVTAPVELPESDRTEFFKSSYAFLSERYGGEKNIISAYVHMDEVTPHMHFAFVPVTRDRKKDIDKVSAKEVVNRKDLQTFHEDLSQHMEKIFGRDVGILNEATREGNKSKKELQDGTNIRIMQEAREQAAQIVRQADQEAATIVLEGQARVEALKGQEKALQGKIEGLEATLRSKVLTEEKIFAIPVTVSRPTFTGGDGKKDRVTLLLSDWENTKKTAIQGARSVAQEMSNSSRAKSLEKREKSVKRREDAVANDETGLDAQRKRADYWVAQAEVYEVNYNRVLGELNQIKNRNRNRDLNL